ncbi:MAG: pyridoxal phosphate-dependent aminotransferase [Gemmatimonadetes bacterium]|nr:pyridoxal phosphate-dependent aminotransferase [Gemmatimonadota bacterium]
MAKTLLPKSEGALSENLAHLKPSETVSINQETQRRKAAGEDVIDLSAGEPDFDTPRAAAESGIKAIQQGKTRYPPNVGLLDLRAAAARHLSLLSGGRPVNADGIVVSTGAKQSIFNAVFTLFGPGDRVLIPSPAWVSYPQIVHLARAEPVMVPGDIEWSLKVSVDDLEGASDDRTAGLILCSPINPTGAVYSRPELKAIAQWAHERGIWLICDEIYRRIHFGSGPAPSVLDFSDDLLERVVLIYGASKAYAMTGWRIGLALAPVKVAKAMAALQTHVTSGACHPAQWAAAAAFGDERVEQDVQRMVEEFRKRRDLVVSHFRRHLPGVEFVEPMGAFYFFFRVDQYFTGGMETAAHFCERLMAEEGVAVVPGDAFGDSRWVRMSFAASEKDLVRALDRITHFARSLGHKQ